MKNREFAKALRDGKTVDIYGNVVCSLDMWEKIARIIEEQADEIDRLKIDTQLNNAEKCVVCGAVIPEGKQVCTKCENYT